jgi:outer membrane protein OmpA-like peptidoglycan-associated protein
MIREMYNGIVVKRYSIYVPTEERIIDKNNGTVAIFKIEASSPKGKALINSMYSNLISDVGRKSLLNDFANNHNKVRNYNETENNNVWELDKGALTSKQAKQKDSDHPLTTIGVQSFLVLFPTDKSTIDSFSKEEKEMFSNASAIIKGTNATVTIVGVSSGVPSRYQSTKEDGSIVKGELTVENNKILSNDRANFIKKVLIENYGVDESRIKIGEPEIKPELNDKDKNKSNQRAEIRFKF